MVAFHGTADRINPYQGHQRSEWVESVPEAAAGWAQANGSASEGQSTSDGQETTVSKGLRCLRYGHEGELGEVVLWTCLRAGHTWPGGRLTHPLLRLWLGRTSTEIDATDTLWRFYLQHQPA